MTGVLVTCCFSAYKVKSIFEDFMLGHTDRVVEELVVVGLLQALDNCFTDYRDTDTSLHTDYTTHSALCHEYSMSSQGRSRKGALVSANY